MAFLWLLLEFIVFFGYFNLTSLKNEEDVERLFENYNSAVNGSIPYGDLDASSSLEVAITSSYPPYVGSAPTTDIVPPGTLAYSSSHPNLQIEWLNDNTKHFSIMKREEIESIDCQNIYFNSQLYENKKRFKKSQARVRSVSDRMIESAERLMQSTSGSYPNYYDNTDMQDEESTNNPTSTNPSTPYDISRPTSLPDEKTSLLGRMRQGNYAYIYFTDISKVMVVQIIVIVLRFILSYLNDFSFVNVLLYDQCQILCSCIPD